MGPSDERAGLVDVAADGPMDPHARIITELLGCDGALVTVVGDDAQHFLGRHGGSAASNDDRRASLDLSLCRDVVARGHLLHLDDLGSNPAYRDHPLRTELGVEAYLGLPLTARSGEAVGAVCALHGARRQWSTTDLEQLQAVADLVQAELRPLLRRARDRRRTEQVTLLLSTLRHELGGELAIVLGGIETAMLPGVDDELRQRVLRNARRDCRRATSTLDALLRMDSRAPAQFREIELRPLVAEVVNGIATDHDTSRVRLEVEDCTLVTEGVLLAHVVRNLVENACKYSEGYVEVTGGCRGDQTWVAVADDGPGLPEAVTEQLFEPFSRPRRDDDTSGFGLGLAIIHTLCERLEGRLEVDTGEHGTTITVVVPSRRQSPKPSNAASSSEGA